VDAHPYHLWAQGGTYPVDLQDDNAEPNPDGLNDAPHSQQVEDGDPPIYAAAADGDPNTWFAFETPDRVALASEHFDGFRYPVYSPPWQRGDPVRGDTNGNGAIDGGDATDKPYWTGMEGRECKLWPPREWNFGSVPSRAYRLPDMHDWPMSDTPGETRWAGWLGYAGYRHNLIPDIAMAYLNAVFIAQANSTGESGGSRLAPGSWQHTPTEIDKMALRLLTGATDGTLDITGSTESGYTVTGGGTGSVAEATAWLESLRTDFINDPGDPADDVNDSPIATACAEIVLNDFRQSRLGLVAEDIDGDGTIQDHESHVLHQLRRAPTDHR